MVEIRNLIRVNGGRAQENLIDREAEQKLFTMMFAQTSRVPELKPISEIRPCGHELDCGHACGGCKGERENDHLPCLEVECRPADKATKFDNCNICSCALGEEPCLELDCGHIFHANCLRELLRHRWSTQRITFNFMKCPSCQQDMDGHDAVPEIVAEITEMRVLKRRLARDALKELKQDGKLENNTRLNDPTDRFYQKPLEYALSVSEFYECQRCHNPFFGGYVNCQDENFANYEEDQEGDGMSEEQLMCQSCRLEDMGIRSQYMCQKHGLRHIQFKCDYCCNLAQFRCRANTYYCEECHENPARRNKYNCGGNQNKCPYNVAHHPTKKGVPIAGCVICKSQALVSNPITTESKHEIHLKKVLHETDLHLKQILLAKKESQKHIDSARRSSVSSRRSAAAASDSGDGSPHSSAGRTIF